MKIIEDICREFEKAIRDKNMEYATKAGEEILAFMSSNPQEQITLFESVLKSPQSSSSLKEDLESFQELIRKNPIDLTTNQGFTRIGELMTQPVVQRLSTYFSTSEVSFSATPVSAMSILPGQYTALTKIVSDTPELDHTNHPVIKISTQ